MAKLFGKSNTSKLVENDVYLMARIVEHAAVNIVVTKPDGVVLFINKYSEVNFKYKRDVLNGSSIENIFSEAGNGLSWVEIRDVLLTEKLCNTTVVIICQGGSEMLCSLHAFAIEDFMTKETMFIFEFKDISDEKIATEQLENKNLEMAKINSELIRSNAELRRVSDLKSNFLSIASHELKTPLTSIKGYSDIMIDTMKTTLESGAYRMIESINRAADRLHRVVNNILDVTRIEQKRLRLKPERMALSEVAQECIDDLSQFSLKRNIRFDCKIDQVFPKFLGDTMRMQQLFTNLFSNAIKFSPDNSVIEVKIELVNNGTEFHIIVKDQGIGIDKTEQKKIFDPFYEVGNATRHSTDYSKFMGGGTGLGLSIVKGIVERHGGRIWVESVGTGVDANYPGSEFHVLLPIEAKIEWDDDETKSMKLSEINEEQLLEQQKAAENIDRKPTILFIDHDREAVEISRMVLENVFDVHVADTGEAGLAMAFDILPSVILVDSYLPGIDGYRVCRILRSQEDTKNIPIAFFSAGSQSSEIQKCFASGADDFIVKPFSGKELVEKIWRLLMKKKEQQNFS